MNKRKMIIFGIIIGVCLIGIAVVGIKFNLEHNEISAKIVEKANEKSEFEKAMDTAVPLITTTAATTESPTSATTTRALVSDWKIDYYTDDFGDKTDDSYVVGKFFGTFSNSATTGSDLTVFVYLDPKYPNVTQIRLLEYGSHKATFLSSQTITIKTKDSQGITNSHELTYYSGDLFSNDSSLRQAIESNSELSIVISTSSEY